MTVEFSPGVLRVDGAPRVLLCASVFPFRIPGDRWAERLRQVADLGYTAVDVYLPWNHHETEPGRWDFTGERDVDGFLRLCAEAGLLVVARPGPYICSEWDGGGLPAWLSTIPGLELRQNEPTYLAEVRRWFDRVMPVLARHQTSRGGAVAMVQLENELDFFDCRDPQGYLARLRDSALAHGIDVPLVVCAGQGDVERAGEVDGVVPAVNLYPSDESTSVEDQAAHYEAALRGRGLPLLVTETNRMHRTLKRLLVSGVRLLGPYLQTSGWNDGWATSVNNWGDPLAFMTHDYDFGGLIAPDGSVRPDAVEARRLAGVVAALGERLAAGVPTTAVSGVAHEPAVAPRALDLDGGGQLIALTNLGADPEPVAITGAGRRVKLAVPGGRCLLLVRGLPLPSVGAELSLCTEELTALAETEGAARLEITTAGRAVALLTTTAVRSTTATGDLDVVVTEGAPRPGVRIAGQDGEARVETDAGVLLVRFRPEPRPEPPAHPEATAPWPSRRRPPRSNRCRGGSAKPTAGPPRSNTSAPTAARAATAPSPRCPRARWGWCCARRPTSCRCAARRRTRRGSPAAASTRGCPRAAAATSPSSPAPGGTRTSTTLGCRRCGWARPAGSPGSSRSPRSGRCRTAGGWSAATWPSARPRSRWAASAAG
ncbi:beta-galactosidase [Actinokineospora soli]|uniref:Beta-galactosidase n=1 Tax=Actinokineospora soli TaxID=1048753 RepID=A0ABW2TNM4_9PSEU